MNTFLLFVFFSTAPAIIEAPGTNAGQYFVVALPKMTSKMNQLYGTPSAMFLLATRFDQLEVYLISRWAVTNLQTLKATFVLTAGRVYQYTVPQAFNVEVDVGLIHSFDLRAKMDFTLTIVLFNNINSIASFVAVPVAHWGRVYYAVTLGHTVSLTLIADMEPNKVTVKLESSSSRNHITINAETVKSGQELTVVLSSSQAYVISTCNMSGFAGTLTGSKISGEKPFGFISGNCYGRTKTFLCNDSSSSHWGSGDIVAEMMLPYETFGRDFLTFTFNGSYRQGFYFLVAGDNDTEVSIADAVQRKLDIFTLQYSGSWVEKTLSAAHITSNKGILVVYVRRSPCFFRYNSTHQLPGEEGAPAMSIIVPTELFYFRYIFSVPQIPSINNFAVLIVKIQFTRFININEVPVKLSTWWPIPGGKQRWSYAHLSLLRELNYTVASPYTVFGCYLYGLDYIFSYMNAAGYVVSNFNKHCQKQMSKSVPGDLIDNDCDGWIDEEYLNQEDDDGDSYIDEDLNTFKEVFIDNQAEEISITELVASNYTPTKSDFPRNEDEEDEDTETQVDPGAVGVWMAWQCAPHCNDSKMFRERLCIRPPVNGPCLHKLKEFREGDCTRNCKKDRPEDYSGWTSWSCVKNCSDKRVFRSRTCIAGKSCSGPLTEWKIGACYLNTTCPEACPEYRWGVNCLKSCENCRDECDKFTGVCKVCKDGFQNPQLSCITSCPEYTYGRQCKENCINKCKEDCKDRSTGECFDKYDNWQVWRCSTLDCNDKRYFRIRSCDSSIPNSKCLGPSIDYKAGNCYVDTICPLNCETKKWGSDCLESCEHCKDDCDKFTGVCAECKPGYKHPNSGCKEICGRNEYGINCEGNCLSKCGDDCIDRKYGHCHVETHTKYALLLLLLILFFPCLGIMCRNKKVEASMVPRRSSYMGKTGMMPRKVSYIQSQAVRAHQGKSTKREASKTDSQSMSSIDDDISEDNDDDD